MSRISSSACTRGRSLEAQSESNVSTSSTASAAHAISTHLRAEDQLGRLGGEEFLVLLPDTDAEAAGHFAERMRAEVAKAPTPVPVTVSIGIATWDDEAPEELLQRADEALYAAKDAGRDRVAAATLHDRT